MSEGSRILIVDDDKDLVAALRVALESKGLRVTAAHDLSTGLEAAAAQRPDCIILDVMMPNATEGFHFVWRLRQKDEAYFKDVPIIILTAIHERTELRFYPDSGDGTYQAGEYLPVQDFVDKPVDPAVLLERIERVLRLKRPA
ncbi:MAG: response regulator [Bryobacteraceae bacterium]|nr:response regulator [Bryobacteraceae bacterium]